MTNNTVKHIKHILLCCSNVLTVKPELLTPAKKLLDNVGWHGVAMVEFKVAVDGTLYLMEINTRFWSSLQLAVDAG